VLSPAALLTHLEHRLPLLSDGARDLPARQRTLRATIAWSDDLLDEGDKALFRRLAVFVGGFTLEAAEALCAGADHAAPRGAVLEGLTSLVEKSLLWMPRGAEADGRFAMLDTIREYALAQLARGDELPLLRRRHAAIFRDLAERAEPGLRGGEQQAWLGRLERELDNLRAALRWAREGGEAELGLRLAGALWYFYHVHGHIGEGRGWLEGLLAQAGAGPAGRPTVAPAVRAKALAGAGWLAYVQTDYDRGNALAEEGLALYRELKDALGGALALEVLACVAMDRGDYGRATTLEEESLAARRAAGDAWWITLALTNLGLLAGLQGDDARARALLEESLALQRGLGDLRGMALSLLNLGTFAVAEGDLARAQALLEESLTLQRALEDAPNAVEGVEDMAQVAAARGQPRQGVRLLGAAEALRAAEMGRERHRPLRADWEAVKDDVMRRAVRRKFETHADLRALLLSTGDADIIENAPRDYYWGCGATGTGKNMLGRILMEVRAALRQETDADAGVHSTTEPCATTMHE